MLLASAWLLHSTHKTSGSTGLVLSVGTDALPRSQKIVRIGLPCATRVTGRVDPHLTLNYIIISMRT